MSKSRREIPIVSHPIIETHFHLDMLKNLSRTEIVEKSLHHNIEKMITISTNPNNLDEVITISETFPQIYCTQGLHPHEGKEWNQDVRAHVIRNLSNIKNKKIVAVGEIGLDYWYKPVKKDKSKKTEKEKK